MVGFGKTTSVIAIGVQVPVAPVAPPSSNDWASKNLKALLNTMPNTATTNLPAPQQELLVFLHALVDVMNKGSAQSEVKPGSIVDDEREDEKAAEPVVSAPGVPAQEGHQDPDKKAVDQTKESNPRADKKMPSPHLRPPLP